MTNFKFKSLIALAVAMSSVPAFAATPAQSLALTLTGTVAPVCSFSVNSVSAATGATPSTTSVTLGLSAASETPASAAVIITCNDSAGYVMTAASVNGGQLKSGTNTLNYKLDLDSQNPVALSTAAQSILAKASLSSPENALSHPLRVTYPAGAPNLLSGTYSDQVTLTLTGN